MSRFGFNSANKFILISFYIQYTLNNLGTKTVISNQLQIIFYKQNHENVEKKNN